MEPKKQLLIIVVAVITTAIIAILLTLFTSTCCIGTNPNTIIKEQLGKAYAQLGAVMVNPAKASFKSGTIFDASNIISEEAMVLAATLTFECSTEIANACALEENGQILRINNDFDAYVSACCRDTYTEPKCIVKVGKEHAKC